MTPQEDSAGQKGLLCLKCNIPLEKGKVVISYMGNPFPVDLPRCAKCGQVFVEEDLAVGRMAEVEKALEDK